MTDMSGQTSATVSGNPARQGFVLAAVFTTAMLLSALLLFFVQPMFAKMALPLLGGSSGVWNTAMVFFQTVLLAGYLYAHLLTKHLGFRAQVFVHGFVLASAMFLLPIALPEGWQSPQAGSPTLWLLALFGVALGLPFFALSANAPLLQKWFSYSTHRSASDPYFLYAASNLGSLAALLGYPILVEPFFRLHDQSWTWALGFVLLFGLIMTSGLIVRRDRSNASELTEETGSVEGIAWKRKLAWIGFALVPSSLMLGVTAHLTTNVASAPFLWVLPLALYLLTFVFAFSPRPIIPPRFIEAVFPFVLFGTLVLITIKPGSFVFELVANLACFFVITQMCHNRLASDRPDVANLTEFYLLMSLGGVIGGAITALAAPVLFNDVYEYHLVVAAAGLITIGKFPVGASLKKEAGLAGLLVLAVGLLAYFASALPLAVKNGAVAGLLAVCLTGLIFARRAPLLLTGVLTSLALLGINLSQIAAEQGDRVIFSERSFFGISKVLYQNTDNGPAHLFQHGNTKHNLELRNPDALGYPLAYYAPGGAFGQAVDAIRREKTNMSVAVVGLGAGAMACHAQEGEFWKYYEIDPVVTNMARNPDLFSYMRRCAPDAEVVTGDARLTLAYDKPGSFDLVMIDAFSSDVIPAHLVTLEAVELYMSRLKEGGYLFFHVSNRNLDVPSVVLNVAREAGLAARKAITKPTADTRYAQQVSPTEAILISRDEQSLARLLADYPDWKEAEGSELVGVWRDDFSHVLGALIAKQRKSGFE